MALGPLVDHQAHWYPEAALRVAVRRGEATYDRATSTYVYERPGGGYRAPLSAPYFRLEEQLGSMARTGIDMAVLSPNLLGDVDGVPAAEAQARVEGLNELISEAQREHPSSVVGLAMLPLEHPERALQTLERAIGELDLRGVCVLSNVAGRPLGDASLWEVFRRIDELGVPVYLHPHNVSVVASSGVDATVEVGAGWMLDTTAAALSLITSGLLDACRSLTVVHPHAGGVVPWLLGRLVECVRLDGGVRAERPLEWYLRHRFFIDSASDTPGALTLARATYGAERIVFASDWPWYPHEHALDLVAEQPGWRERNAMLQINRVPGLRLGLPEEGGAVPA